jgi:chemotaxis response regulator CheB
MPEAAISAVAVDWILSLSDIASVIVELCHSIRKSTHANGIQSQHPPSR